MSEKLIVPTFKRLKTHLGLYKGPGPFKDHFTSCLLVWNGEMFQTGHESLRSPQCAEHSLENLKKNAEYAKEEVVLNYGDKVFLTQCLVLLVQQELSLDPQRGKQMVEHNPRGGRSRGLVGSVSDRTGFVK